MIRDDRQRLWQFSRSERIAIILLLIAIGVTLCVRTYVRQGDSIEVTDTTWIETEVPLFEQEQKKAQKPAKKEKTYTPRQQILRPVEQETPHR